MAQPLHQALLTQLFVSGTHKVNSALKSSSMQVCKHVAVHALRRNRLSEEILEVCCENGCVCECVVCL